MDLCKPLDWESPNHAMSLEASTFLNPKPGFPWNRRFTASATVFPSPHRRRRTALPSFPLLSSRKTALHAPSNVPAFLESKSGSVMVEEISDPPVKIVAIVGQGSPSPLKSATWEEVMLHTVRKLINYFHESFLYAISLIIVFNVKKIDALELWISV